MTPDSCGGAEHESDSPCSLTLFLIFQLVRTTATAAKPNT